MVKLAELVTFKSPTQRLLELSKVISAGDVPFCADNVIVSKARTEVPLA